MEALAHLLDKSPLSVFAHNVECVPRLDDTVRDHRASFSQSIAILAEAKKLRPDILTKSSIMVGLGESDEEVTQTLQLLKDANVDLITIGQYLAPSSKHLVVDRFPRPEQYDVWAKQAIAMGFSGIASGPLVRSSFKAGLLLRKSQDPKNSESMPGAYVYVNGLQDIHTTSLKADID
jgi:lipoic acid synthetase